ncbi:VOC family protein [Sphingobium nicotianae]|uniref:VOC family protein n=1 Tax=Sphingobium nicotianae TaxID=2782607 RepID=A0A9X1DBP7_9SPHN|nr:VOC family protein [Sphingobium nicotianae]MBT2187028.1 VOC family protein [Sphingobium nicotianae]
MIRKMRFGGEIGTICQMAYVVKDIDEAIAWWVEKMGVGPWFVLPSFGGEGHVFRGKPCTSYVKIAMSFAGSMNIELLQTLDDEPSVYKETIDRVGYGFHHFGFAIAGDEIEAEVERRVARGEVLAHRAPVPTGGKVAYFEGGAGAPGFVELIPATAGMDEGFTRFWEQTREWDGKDPIRPFA